MNDSYWRSVSNSNNAWAIESFMDELALAANTDPLALRLALLAKLPRQRAVLQRVAHDAGYSPTPQQGRAVGIASMECYDSYVAVAAAVSGGPDKVKLDKLWIAADCGIVVHPDQAVAQLEGRVERPDQCRARQGDGEGRARRANQLPRL